jgi:hypothetical protein
LLSHFRRVLCAPDGRRPNAFPHLCRFAGIEGCGCADGAVAASNDVIGGFDESKAGRGGQWDHLIGGDLAFSAPIRSCGKVFFDDQANDPDRGYASIAVRTWSNMASSP